MTQQSEEDLQRFTVYEKHQPKPFGNVRWNQLKFKVYIFDGFNNYRAYFDACHFDSFSVGDVIRIEYKKKEGSFLIYKRHKVVNVTQESNIEKEYTMRPTEEIECLLGKANKRYDEIKASLEKHPPVATATNLRREKKDIVRLVGVLKFALTGKIIAHPELDPTRSFESCNIVTRYLNVPGETIESVLERSERRLEVVTKTSREAKDSEEFTNLNKFITALKWLLDQAKDTNIGCQFGMGIFSAKLRDDYALHGIERDEYLIPQRRAEDKQLLYEDAKRALSQLEERRQEEKLAQQFPFLRRKGMPKK